ncbi:MAG: type I restriction enzyme HsdR N-terminal domain-containing protein [Lentimicrobium sp.]|nr:type I restriction enzyme HsdR N-terminal domain-containing protein [Lentimicrobium sp.]
MQALNLPEYNLRTRQQGGQLQIFDPIRKKFVALTPEEWVRQNLIQYLSINKNIPLHMMACERGLVVNRMTKRFDLLVYNTSGKPVMIVECKAPSVVLSDDVYFQIARYNLALKVNYLLVSNGIQHVFGVVDYSSGIIVPKEEIYDYQKLCSE